MASHIHIEATGPVTESGVREQLRDVSEEALSQSSPVTEGVPEAGVYETTDGTVHVRVQGHDGDWTKTSQEAVCQKIRAANHDVETAVVSGGYGTDDGE